MYEGLIAKWHICATCCLEWRSSVAAKKAVTQARLWHLRMSHISELGLKDK